MRTAHVRHLEKQSDKAEAVWTCSQAGGLEEAQRGDV